MNKLILSALAVVTAVGVVAVQPAEAKKAKQEPISTPIVVPMNEEMSSINGTTKEVNDETQKRVRKLSETVQSMIKKDWKTIYIHAIPNDDTMAVRYYYEGTDGQMYSGQVIKNLGQPTNKLLMGSFKQTMALRNLYTYMKRSGQEMPSTIDITVTQEGRRIRTVMNYGEDVRNVQQHQNQWEQEHFPNLK